MSFPYAIAQNGLVVLQVALENHAGPFEIFFFVWTDDLITTLLDKCVQLSMVDFSSA
jgi:hypothetical protein